MKIDMHEKDVNKMILNAKENKEMDFVPLEQLINKHT